MTIKFLIKTCGLRLRARVNPSYSFLSVMETLESHFSKSATLKFSMNGTCQKGEPNVTSLEPEHSTLNQFQLLAAVYPWACPCYCLRFSVLVYKMGMAAPPPPSELL